MKKIFLLLAGVLVVSSISAQNFEKNIISVRGGLNIANMTQKLGGHSTTLDPRVGFHIGATDQILLFNNLPLYLEPGLFLSARGAKYNDTDPDTKYTPIYLQIPVVVNYHFNIKDKVSIEPFAGIYYALGLGGKIKQGSEKADLFGDNGEMKRSDFGVRLGAGVVFAKHFYVGLGYEVGCMNLAKNDKIDLNEDGVAETKVKVHANCCTISVGYKF